MPPAARLVHVLLALAAAASAAAHMAMAEPAPLRYKTNPYRNLGGDEDYDYLSPLSPSGSNYPCRGHLSALGTPAGQPVATYAPGGTYAIRLDGSAVHNGGSCQLALSYDRGASWSVIKSFIGGCVRPLAGADQTFRFTVPAGAPRGDALLAWTWFNNEGNREFYMNCAAVTVGGGARARRRAPLGPPLFVANLQNGCATVEGTDVDFPDPGADVERAPGAPVAPPTGSCGAVAGGGGASGSGALEDCAHWRARGYICSAASGFRWDAGARWGLGLALGVVGAAIQNREAW